MKRNYLNSKTEDLPLEGLSVKALKKVQAQHHRYEKAMETYTALKKAHDEAIKKVRAPIENELSRIETECQELVLKRNALWRDLHPLELGLLDRLIGVPSISFHGKVYDRKAEKHVQLLRTLDDREHALSVKKFTLERTLGKPAVTPAPREPRREARLRDPLRTFVFDVALLPMLEIERLIEKKEAEDLLERERERAKLEPIRARAAAYEKKQREHAKSIRGELEKQLHQVPFCPYCASALSIDNAHADHIYPVSKGGLSTRKNMVFICATCNVLKGGLTLRQFIKKAGRNEEEIYERLEELGKDY